MTMMTMTMILLLMEKGHVLADGFSTSACLPLAMFHVYDERMAAAMSRTPNHDATIWVTMGMEMAYW